MRTRAKSNLRPMLAGIGIFFCLPLGISLSQVNCKSTPRETHSPSTLIVQLQSDRFSERQSAMYRIMVDPEPVIPFIEMAIESSDADFRIRTLRILTELASDHSVNAECRLNSGPTNDLRTAALEAVNRISLSSNPGVARHAENAKFKILMQRQYLAAKNLERLNAKVNYSSAHDRDECPMIRQLTIDDSWRGTRQDLEMLGDLVGVTKVELSHASVDDRVVEMLSAVHGLTTLRLNRCSITGDSIRYLSQIGTLRDLELLYCPIGLESLSELDSLEKLASIRLIGTNVEPIQTAKLEQRLATAKVDIRRGAFMGIRYSPTSPECKLTSLVPGSGADKAGLQRGDTIVKFNDNPVSEYLDVTLLLRECEAGDHVAIKATRDGKVMSFDVLMGDWK